MNLAIWLERTALKHPKREALFLGSKCIGTYRDFWLAVCALRAHLEKEGVEGLAIIYLQSVWLYLKPFY